MRGKVRRRGEGGGEREGDLGERDFEDLELLGGDLMGEGEGGGEREGEQGGGEQGETGELLEGGKTREGAPLPPGEEGGGEAQAEE